MTNHPRLSILILVVLALFCSMPLQAEEEEEVIEHIGDGYVINVDRMELNGEESLMDMLMMCPEFVSEDGRTILSNYNVFIDGLEYTIDEESFLYHIKARDISAITVLTASVVMNGDDALEGEIDIFFKDGAQGSQAALWASTYGSAELYSDLTYRSKDRRFTLTGSVVGHTLYQSYYGEETKTSSHRAMENVRLVGRWAMTERDSLQLVFTQNFTYSKLRSSGETNKPGYSRELNFIGAYLHDLNDNNATLYVETGLEYSNCDEQNQHEDQTSATALMECYLPLVGDELAVSLGTEHNYLCSTMQDFYREKRLYNDFYVQLEFEMGRWQAAVGDRFRMMTFWHNPHTRPSQGEQWKYSRSQHGLLGSLEYNMGKGHYLQGVFSQRYYTPMASNFAQFDTHEAKWFYNTDFRTTAFVSELKYTYQRKNLVFMGSVENTNFRHVEPDEVQNLQAVYSSLWWHWGPLHLTLGATYFHADYGKDEEDGNEVLLKVMPSVALSSKTQLTGTFLYVGKQKWNEQTPNTYLDIRLNHRISPRVNIYADYHDIAQQKTGNRALIVGTSIRF